MNNIPMRCRSKMDGSRNVALAKLRSEASRSSALQELWREPVFAYAAHAARGYAPALRKPSNAADAVFDRNPEGQADLRAFLCRKPLVVNDTTARLASWTASQIGSVASVYYLRTSS